MNKKCIEGAIVYYWLFMKPKLEREREKKKKMKKRKFS
jgi:type II secretory pathway component PulM